MLYQKWPMSMKVIIKQEKTDGENTGLRLHFPSSSFTAFVLFGRASNHWE